ncbi:MAG: hypothetical protein H7039_01750 [Bryobacteraceae bacterium]|nr:hypothetical protein [Bryobacteraceae bacterium]
MPRYFEYPLQPVPQIAIYESSESLAREPANAQTVALPATLLPVAFQWDWTPAYPIVVFTGPFSGSLTRKDREQIWQQWGVPVLEYRLDLFGNVIAEECEARAGLHVRSEATTPSDAEFDQCACGLSSPRIPPSSDNQYRNLTVAA